MSKISEMQEMHQSLAEKVAKGEELTSIGSALFEQLKDSPAFKDLVARKKRELGEKT